MSPPRDCPVRRTRRTGGTSPSGAGRILISPLDRASASGSTVMPGRVTRIRLPPTRRSTSMSRTECVMTASVKSSFASQNMSRISIRRGTSQRPVRVTSPNRWSMLMTSLACGGRPSRGRSAVSRANSSRVRADRAASSRSSSSPRVSRPSPAAVRRISTTWSRSRSDARSAGLSSWSAPSPAGRGSPVMARFLSPSAGTATVAIMPGACPAVSRGAVRGPARTGQVSRRLGWEARRAAVSRAWIRAPACSHASTGVANGSRASRRRPRAYSRRSVRP